MNDKYVIGLDFGTDSVRAILTSSLSGKVVEEKVAEYPRWKKGAFCNPGTNQFRQHPLDHFECMNQVIQELLDETSADPLTIKGICIDTTGSSPLPLNEKGEALAMENQFAQNPNALMVLWKDHTAIREADEINQLARSWGGVDYTRFEGGIYSSEWFWAKILHIIREDEAVRDQAWTWMEHCDYMTYILCGSPDLKTFKRSRCAAGHKAMWHASWGGLPATEFLEKLNPYLANLRDRLYQETYTSDEAAGTLSDKWAKALGLTTQVTVAVGTFDAHAGAVGAEIKEKTLVRVMGTSTCDIIVSSQPKLSDQTVRGICGQVNGSVIPGLIGLEAGQSAFGDVLAWFRDVLLRPIQSLVDQSDILSGEQKSQLKKEAEEKLIEILTEEAEKIDPSPQAPVALDWINGRRTPDANQALKAAIMGMDLGTDAARTFRSLVEAICFGARKIVDRFESEGVEIDEVVGIGGVARKSNLVMQTLADVLNRPIKIAASDQAPALGAAMYAAVAAGIHSSVEAAQKAMGNGFDEIYQPIPQHVEVYHILYKRYSNLAEFTEQNTFNS